MVQRKGIVIMYEHDSNYREETETTEERRQSEAGWTRQGDYSDPWHSQGQEQQYSRMNMSHIPPEPVKKPVKQRPMAAKIAGITAAALLFGTVAGGTMLGVNTAGEYLKTQYGPKEETQASLATVETRPAAETEPAKSQTSAMLALQMDVSSIVEAAMPSVVAITNTMVLEQRTWFGSSQRYEVPSSGSAIIVGQNDDELLIVM